MYNAASSENSSGEKNIKFILAEFSVSNVTGIPNFILFKQITIFEAPGDSGYNYCRKLRQWAEYDAA